MLARSPGLRLALLANFYLKNPLEILKTYYVNMMFEKFINSLKDKRTREEYLKSAGMGLVTAAIDFLITAAILFISDSEAYAGSFLSVFSANNAGHHVSVVITATLIGFSVAFLLNYVLSVFFVYRYGNVGKNKNGFIKFLIFALCGLVMTTLGTFLGVQILRWRIWLVKILVTVLVFIFNMFTRKRLIFNIELIMDEDNTINL